MLHIGGARTALYNWLLARGSGGSLVLRIEDTDRERSTPENVEQILDALRWLELDWDEGPLSQAERGERHAAAAEQLLDAGHAYEDDGAVRFRVPDEGEIGVEDPAPRRGLFPLPGHQGLRDPALGRQPALQPRGGGGRPRHGRDPRDPRRRPPLEHSAPAADARALGAEPPVYAHLPLLHGPDGKKLSKRHGAASVQELREAGYLPEAVRNYIALLGWGDEDSSTFFTTRSSWSASR